MMKDKPKFKIAPIKIEGAIPRVDLSPSQKALRRSFGALAKTMRNIDWTETEEITKRMRAAKKNPDDPRSEVWEAAVGHTTPRAASLFWRYLPDPLKRRRGQRGNGPVASNDAFIEEMVRRIENEGKPAKTVAREMIHEGKDAPIPGSVDNRANYWGRLYRQRAKK